jgi:hypothetical protein
MSNSFEKEKDVCHFKKKQNLIFISIGKFYRLMKQGMSGEEALAKINVSPKKESNDDDEDDDDGDSEIDEDELT